MLLQIAIFHYFLWLSNIPVCVCVCVCVYHIFIHSSVSGHLHNFLVLVIVNNAVMNIEVHVSLNKHFIFSEYVSQKSGIPGSYGNSIFSFLRKLHTVSIVFSASIPTSSVGGSLENLEL